MRGSIEVQAPYRGRLFSVEVLTWTDDRGRTVHREVARHPGAVLIVGERPGDRVLMLRNWRVAVEERLWELPAGTLGPGEDPMHAAARELEEETGWRPGRIEPLGEFYTSPGFTDELMRVFVAGDLSWAGQKLEPHEDLEAVELAREEVLAMLDDGRIRDGKTIAGIHMWIARRREGGGGGRP